MMAFQKSGYRWELFPAGPPPFPSTSAAVQRPTTPIGQRQPLMSGRTVLRLPVNKDCSLSSRLSAESQSRTESVPGEIGIASSVRSWWARLRALFGRGFLPAAPFPQPSAEPSAKGRPLFLLVEGPNDVEFLRRMSVILHHEDSEIPDLASMERDSTLVFVPIGGGDVRPWAFRLAETGAAECHIYDRETPPETEIRQQVVRIVNLRPKCRAFLTTKRNLENYLDRDAIIEASGVAITFGDHDDVADVLARSVYEQCPRLLPWEQLPARSRKRRRDKIKRSLNTKAVDRMTPERLARSDPAGEVRHWLLAIAELARDSQ